MKHLEILDLTSDRISEPKGHKINNLTMASVAASIRRVVTTTARQSPLQVCRSAIKMPLVPRSFSSYQSLWAEMDTGSQVGMNVQAGQRVEVLDGVAHREPPEGDLDNIAEKEWEFDDFSSMAHAELERHREARQYARIAAYEMPRLSGKLNIYKIRSHN